jgi:hypothetical protein
MATERKKKLVLVADMTPISESPETHATPWGKVWTRGSDVMVTWRRHGFVPPSEVRDDYYFKINREGGRIEQ